MEQRISKANPKAWMALQGILCIGLGVILGTASCGKATKVRDCLPIDEYTDLKTKLNTLEGESEYAILGLYGKPKNISMNARSEKDYIFTSCEVASDTTVVRFTPTGRVKEVFER
jgi:hypothetical protein